jgi:hypothetical protein
MIHSAVASIATKESCKFVLNIICNLYCIKVWRYLQTYSRKFPFERKFFQLFPFEQAIKPGSNVKKLTGRIIRRAQETRGGKVENRPQFVISKLVDCHPVPQNQTITFRYFK